MQRGEVRLLGELCDETAATQHAQLYAFVRRMWERDRNTHGGEAVFEGDRTGPCPAHAVGRASLVCRLVCADGIGVMTKRRRIAHDMRILRHRRSRVRHDLDGPVRDALAAQWVCGGCGGVPADAGSPSSAATLIHPARLDCITFQARLKVNRHSDRRPKFESRELWSRFRNRPVGMTKVQLEIHPSSAYLIRLATCPSEFSTYD